VQCKKAEGKVTLSTWAEFTHLFVGLRQLVDSWSEEESKTLVLKQLNTYFFDKVVSEQTKRRRNKHWVRVTYNGPEDTQKILDQFEHRLQHSLPVMKAENQCRIVDTGSERNKNLILMWDKGDFGGHTVRVTPVEYEMSSDDILKFVGELLESREEVAQMDQHYGSRRDPPSKVREAKEDEPAKKGGGKRGPKGGRQNSPPKEKPWYKKTDGRNNQWNSLPRGRDDDKWQEVSRKGGKDNGGKNAKGGKGGDKGKGEKNSRRDPTPRGTPNAKVRPNANLWCVGSA
jgi:hypothetical protein